MKRTAGKRNFSYAGDGGTVQCVEKRMEQAEGTILPAGGTGNLVSDAFGQRISQRTSAYF